MVDGIKCPACGSEKVAKVLYGLPAFSDELEAQIDAGNVVLNGCCVDGPMHPYECQECGLRFDEAGIAIVVADITTMGVDAIVNAANEGLRAGGGVCGAIFAAAGHDEMREACAAIGHCDTGRAVVTPGFALPARHVIHAVGPIWQGGSHGEPALLASCYASALDLAVANGCTSIAFPLISAGIYGYPKRGAWCVALSACADWLAEHSGIGMNVLFCVLDDESFRLGCDVMVELGL